MPYCFYTLSGVQYNPGIHPEEGSPYHHNMWVTTDEDEEALSMCELAFLREHFENNYPNHTILDDSTYTYNCHGYSFSVFQGGEKCNISWCRELCTYSFVEVQTPQKGDVAVIRTDIGNNQYAPMSIHSSIVESQDTLISKWGIGLLTKHHKNDLVDIGDVGTINIYTYYRRIINTPNQISGPYTFNGSGLYVFYPSIPVTSCSWSVEPAAMFQQSSGTGEIAELRYATPFVHLAPKASITFTFSYGCDNHYTVSKEFDLRIPTTTVSGVAESDGFVIDNHSIVTVTGEIRSNPKAKAIVPTGSRLVIDGGKMTSKGSNLWPGIEVWGNSAAHQFPRSSEFAIRKP